MLAYRWGNSDGLGLIRIWHHRRVFFYHAAPTRKWVKWGRTLVPSLRKRTMLSQLAFCQIAYMQKDLIKTYINVIPVSIFENIHAI